MSPGFKKECKRRTQSLHSNFIFGVGATRPLYFNINEHGIKNIMVVPPENDARRIGAKKLAGRPKTQARGYNYRMKFYSN